MWTYMMAASRGERSNMMMSASRRRNESESPKYGYNVGRSMPYRSTARHNVLPLHSTSSTHPPATYAHESSSSTKATYYESHQRRSRSIHAGDTTTTTNLASVSNSAASTVSPPPFHTHAAAAATSIQRLPSYSSYHNHSNQHNHQHHHHITHATASIDDDGTSLFSPLSPCTPLNPADDKDTHIFIYKGAKAKTTRKRLIANHVGDMMHEEGVGGVEPHHMSMDAASEVEKDEPVGLMAERGRRYVRDAGTRDAGTESDMMVGMCARGGASGRRENNDPGVGSSGPEDDDSIEEDYLELESGKRMSQEQTKRTKPSTLRRTLNALRQRLTRRSRSKPPDWFLEKFSNTNNVDKIGKTTPATITAAAAAASEDGACGPNAASTAPADEGLSSEIRGTSRLCNRLSVNPTLQSHYRWLGIVSLAVLYNIIFVVGRSVFWEINHRAPTVWYFLDYLCDLIYLFDTLVHMHEGYLDQGLLVRDAYKLRHHYFHTKGWSIDVLSMLPTDLAYIWWSPNSCNASMLPCPVIVRLNRLLRAPRLWEWFDRTETATGYPNAFRICKVVLAILVLIHWNACMYFAISYALGFGTDNWVYNLNGSRNSTLQRQYIYSFYWSTLTLTTIGETPTPENDAEYLFVVADFLAGVLIFATIVGNIGSMISNMNVARVEFQNRMDGVKQYMAFRKVGHELEARVIRWFAYTWSQSGALDEERVLAALPDKLKAEIAIQVHMDTLKQVRIFHDCEPGLLEALVLKLKLQVFSPGDYICRKGDVGKEMYIVKRGKLSVVADDGVTVFATLGAGSVFGEVSVLEIAGNRTGNRRTANVRSLGYSDLFCLAKRDLWETLSDYPEARATLTERGCQLLRKDGLLDESVFADSQRSHDSIESGMEKLEMSVENLNVRLARLLAEYTASQAKLKQRLAKLEAQYQLTYNSNVGLGAAELQTRPRSGRLYSLQPKKRTRPNRIMASTKSEDSKQNTL